MYYVPQIQHDDCGFACLKMLLANVQKDRNYLFLPQEENHGPYSFAELIDIAKEHGVTLTGYVIEEKSQVTEVKKFPFIAHLLTKNGGHHAVLVYRIKFGRVFYLDPRLGKLDVSIKKFLTIWDGQCLLMENMEYQSCPYREAKPLSIGQTIIICLLEALVGLFAIAGVYFINDNAYVFIPIILFSLAVIFEIIVKAYSISLMKRVDSYFYGQLENKNRSYYATMQRFERYKKSLLANPLQFILTLIVSMGLMFVVLHNDIKNFLLIAAPFLASVIEAYFYRPYIKSGLIDIEEGERALDSSQDDDEFRDRIEQLHKKSYRLGLLEMSKQYVGLALFIAMSVLLLALNQTPNFPYAVFYVCIEIAIYITFAKMFSYPEKEDEMLKEKVEISNYLHQNDEN